MNELDTLKEALELMYEKMEGMNKAGFYTRTDKDHMKQYIESMEMLVENAKTPTQKPRIAIIIEGGLVQNVLASEDMDIAIVEWDEEHSDDDEKFIEIFPGSHGVLQSMPPELGHEDLETIIDKMKAAGL